MIKLKIAKTGIVFNLYSWALITLLLLISCTVDNLVNLTEINTNPGTSLGLITTTTTGSTTGTTSATIYVRSGPVKLRSNTTVSGLTINLMDASSVGITGNSVSNVRITNCRILNTTSFAINLYNCKNITIDNCFISNVGFGVNVQKSVTIKVNSNQMLNINGINTSSFGHAVQFNNVNGGGNQINYNRVENIAGVAIHPHDVLSVFKSNGLPGDSIQVIGNWIRGGQMSLWPTRNSGACGIGLGDVGGSYQVCRNNILVNPGYVGIQAQGGSHIKVDHNQIYSSSTPVSLLGMSWGNYSGTTSTDVIYAYNQVRWYDYNNNEHSFGQNGTGVTLISNTWGATNISSSILPTTIITMK